MTSMDFDVTTLNLGIAASISGCAPPPPLVLSGHAASLTPYQTDTPRPSRRQNQHPAAVPLPVTGARPYGVVRGEGRDVSD
jgi:hypothetical protein